MGYTHTTEATADEKRLMSGLKRRERAWLRRQARERGGLEPALEEVVRGCIGRPRLRSVHKLKHFAYARSMGSRGLGPNLERSPRMRLELWSWIVSWLLPDAGGEPSPPGPPR